MKCPLLRMGLLQHTLLGKSIQDNCLKEECAWWDNTNDMCAILQLSKSVYFVGLCLPEIEDKMPSFQQFTK